MRCVRGVPCVGFERLRVFCVVMMKFCGGLRLVGVGDNDAVTVFIINEVCGG